MPIVFGIVFVEMMSFGFILPALPFFVRDVLQSGGLGLGLVFSSQSVAQLLGAAVLGRASDRLGRRRVLLVCLLGSTLGMVLTGIAGSLLMLCLARAVSGLTGGMVATSQAFVADVTPRADRARSMGKIGAAIGSGMIVGPLLGAGALALGLELRAIAHLAAAVLAVTLVTAALRLREPARHATEQPARRFAEVVGHSGLWQLYAAILLTVMGFVGMETTLAFLTADRFSLPSHRFGLLLAFTATVMVVVQGGLIGPLGRRFGVRRLAITGGLTMAVALLTLAWSPTMTAVLVGLGILGLAQGLASPSLSTLLSATTDAAEQGAVLGVGRSMASLARASAPLAAGALYDLDAAAPYVCGALLALIAGGLVFAHRAAPAPAEAR